MSDARRLIAWRRQLLEAHARLRRALAAAQDALRDGAELPDVSRDLLLYCHGFCVALDGHHRGEDALLFPALVAQFPETARIVEKLTQDHDMISTLMAGLDAAARSAQLPATIALHLQGLAAIMESHFRFEERELEPLLDRLQLEAAPGRVFGPL